jgi:hypothetical protein
MRFLILAVCLTLPVMAGTKVPAAEKTVSKAKNVKSAPLPLTTRASHPRR